jgi:hypothetical protein
MSPEYDDGTPKSRCDKALPDFSQRNGCAVGV